MGHIHHEKPHDVDDPLNKQNIKDRIDGRNDPVAAKILERVKQQQLDYEREKKEEESDSSNDSAED